LKFCLRTGLIFSMISYKFQLKRILFLKILNVEGNRYSDRFWISFSLERNCLAVVKTDSFSIQNKNKNASLFIFDKYNRTLEKESMRKKQKQTQWYAKSFDSQKFIFKLSFRQLFYDWNAIEIAIIIYHRRAEDLSMSVISIFADSIFAEMNFWSKII
jgi:hypothetical protein